MLLNLNSSISKVYIILDTLIKPPNTCIGDVVKGQFEGIALSDAATDSYFVRSNGIFTAIPTKTGGGGTLGVMKAYGFKRFEADLP